MSHNLPRTKTIYHLEDIDGAITGAQTIMILPNQKFYPAQCIVEVISSNGLISVPVISIGAASLYNNIVEETPLAGLLNANNLISFDLTGLRTSVSAGAVVAINIISAAVGSEGLDYKMRCILAGVLI